MTFVLEHFWSSDRIELLYVYCDDFRNDRGGLYWRSIPRAVPEIGRRGVISGPHRGPVVFEADFEAFPTEFRRRHQVKKDDDFRDDRSGLYLTSISRAVPEISIGWCCSLKLSPSRG